jgi:hypothetical protein
VLLLTTLYHHTHLKQQQTERAFQKQLGVNIG